MHVVVESGWSCCSCSAVDVINIYIGTKLNVMFFSTDLPNAPWWKGQVRLGWWGKCKLESRLLIKFTLFWLQTLSHFRWKCHILWKVTNGWDLMMRNPFEIRWNGFKTKVLQERWYVGCISDHLINDKVSLPFSRYGPWTWMILQERSVVAENTHWLVPWGMHCIFITPSRCYW